MSESTSNPGSAGPAAPPGEGAQVTAADILVTDDSAEVVSAAAAETPELPAMAGEAGDRLELADVLPGADAADPDLGAYLSIDVSGGQMVISVDPDGIGGAAPVAVVTLEGVQDVTLQQLLNINHIG